MKGREDLAEVVRYLVDVQDEYSPSRFRLYMSSVKSHMTKKAYAELEAALQELTIASERVDRAVKEMQNSAPVACRDEVMKLTEGRHHIHHG